MMWPAAPLHLAFILCGAVACGGGAPPARPAARTAVEADPLRAIRVTAPDGSHPVLPALGGDILVVALWATWCEPCLEELPRIDDLRQQYAGDRTVEFVAVNVDDEPAKAIGEIHRLGLTLPAFRDGEPLMRALAPRPGLPLVAVIDWRARPARLHRKFGYLPGGTSIAELTAVIDAARNGSALPAENLLIAGEPESPMVLALPRMNDDERRRHLPELRGNLERMFPRFTAPQLDRVIERAAEISIDGGNLLIEVPADIPLTGARPGGGPVPFY